MGPSTETAYKKSAHDGDGRQLGNDGDGGTYHLQPIWPVGKQPVTRAAERRVPRVNELRSAKTAWVTARVCGGGGRAAKPEAHCGGGENDTQEHRGVGPATLACGPLRGPSVLQVERHVEPEDGAGEACVSRGA